MIFDFPGYTLTFIQKETSKDDTAHQYTYIFKFYSPVTRYSYIVRAEYHSEDIFGVKFYCKKDRRSDYKYSKLTNRGDVGNILISCAKVVPFILDKHPTASFGFLGARTIDSASGKVEGNKNNQRFRIYKKVVGYKFGTITFEHIEYPEISGYLLINRNSGVDVVAKEIAVRRMFTETYNNLPNI